MFAKKLVFHKISCIMNKSNEFSNLKFKKYLKIEQQREVFSLSLSLSLSLSAKRTLKTCFLASIVFCFSLLFLASCKQKEEIEEIIDYNSNYELKIDLLLEEQKVPSFIFDESYYVVSNRYTNAIINDNCIEFECPEDFLDFTPHDKYNFNDDYDYVPPHSGYYVGISLFQEEKNLLDKFDFISLLDVQYVDCSYKKYGLFKSRQDYDYIIQIESDNKDCVSYYLENSNGHIWREKSDTGETLFLQIIGESVGSTQITVKLLDNNENVILSEKINVIVKNNYISGIKRVNYIGNLYQHVVLDESFVYLPLGASVSLEQDISLIFEPEGVDISKCEIGFITREDSNNLKIDNGVIEPLDIGNDNEITVLVKNIFGQVWSKTISVNVVSPYLVDMSFTQDQIYLTGLGKNELKLIIILQLYKMLIYLFTLVIQIF